MILWWDNTVTASESSSPRCSADGLMLFGNQFRKPCSQEVWQTNKNYKKKLKSQFCSLSLTHSPLLSISSLTPCRLLRGCSTSEIYHQWRSVSCFALWAARLQWLTPADGVEAPQNGKLHLSVSIRPSGRQTSRPVKSRPTNLTSHSQKDQGVIMFQILPVKGDQLFFALKTGNCCSGNNWLIKIVLLLVVN